MSHRRTGIAGHALLLACLLGPPAASARADEAAFTEGLAAVDRAMAGGQWDRARESLVALLDEHAEQPYVLLSQNAVEERLLECAFRAGYPEPDPSDVIAGEILDWNPRNGSLELRYVPQRPGSRPDAEDGDDEADADEPEMSEATKVMVEQFESLFGLAFDGDWEWAGGYPVHPLVFDGPYTVEIEGVMPSDEGEGEFNFLFAQPHMLVRLSPTEWFAFDFGSMASKTFGTRLYTTASAVHSVDGRGRVVDEYGRPLFDPSEPYSVKLQVSNTKITASANGRSVLKVDKPRDVWGQFAFGRCPGVTSLTIDGTTSPTWLRGKLDGHLVEKRAEFAEDFDVTELLPAWLAERDRGRERTPDEHLSDVPGRDDPLHERQLEQLAQFREEGELEKALEHIENLAPALASRSFRLYHTAILQCELGQDEEALDTLGKLELTSADHPRVRLLRARLMNCLGRQDAREQTIRALVDARPDDVLGHEALAHLQLERGELDAAHETVRAAILAGVPAPELRGVEQVLRGALEGPRWPETQTAAHGRWVVHTDVDRGMADDAAEHLEDALAMHEQLFGVDLPRDAELRVYLFGGRAGYRDYVTRVGGPSWVGLAAYLPALGQLVAHHVPDERIFHAVLRHESWHAYLDALGVRAPVWLDEGVATYMEAVNEGRRGLEPGGAKPEHVARLNDDDWEWTPLDELLRTDRTEWAAKRTELQPQAWALVHTLLHDEHTDSARFERLCADLAEGMPAREANERFLEDLDLDDLARRVRVHVLRLR